MPRLLAVALTGSWTISSGVTNYTPLISHQEDLYKFSGKHDTVWLRTARDVPEGSETTAASGRSRAPLKRHSETLHVSEPRSPNEVSAPRSHLPLHSEDPCVFWAVYPLAGLPFYYCHYRDNLHKNNIYNVISEHKTILESHLEFYTGVCAVGPVGQTAFSLYNYY